jgi:hypothetical protein
MLKMLRKILVFALCVLPLTCFAEWALVGETDDAILYIDNKPIKRSGKDATILVLTSYKEPQKKEYIPSSYQSTVIYNACDCNENMIKLLYMMYHKNKDGSGGVVFSTGPLVKGKWDIIASNSVGEMVCKKACEGGVNK